MKVTPKSDDSGQIVGYVFHCPGCEHGHIYYTSGKVTWQFNGNLDNPTFRPSLLNTCHDHVDPKQRVCHLYVTDGKIVFLPDCSNDYAGKTVPMPDR